MLNILITSEIPAQSKKNISSFISTDIFTEPRPMSSAELVAMVKQKAYDAIVCTHQDQINETLLAAAGSQLKVVGTMSSGFDHIDIEACKKKRIEVYNAPGLTTDVVADYVIGLLITGVRRLDQDINSTPDVKTSGYYLWNCKGSELSSLTIGIVGMGRIGKAVAKRLVGFDSTLLYSSSTRKESAEQEYGVKFLPFEQLLSESDVVIASCSLTESSRNMFREETFRLMKPDAIFLNVARAGICDQEALYQALKNNQLKCAVLDVTTPEPLPQGHPLMQLDNCLVFPHIGANVENGCIAIADYILEKINRHFS